jgi:hypothetical protein
MWNGQPAAQWTRQRQTRANLWTTGEAVDNELDVSAQTRA